MPWGKAAVIACESCPFGEENRVVAEIISLIAVKKHIGKVALYGNPKQNSAYKGDKKAKRALFHIFTGSSLF